MLVALVILLHSCASVVALVRQVSAVSSPRKDCNWPAYATIHSIRLPSSPLTNSLYPPCLLHQPSDDCNRARDVWRSSVVRSRLRTKDGDGELASSAITTASRA